MVKITLSRFYELDEKELKEYFQREFSNEDLENYILEIFSEEVADFMGIGFNDFVNVKIERTV